MFPGTIKILAKVKSLKQIVNDPTWQTLRKSFIGTWQEHAAANVKRLRDYLGENPNYAKLRRVLNYITGSGFRSKTITHPSIDSLRESVKKKLEQLRSK